MAAQYPSPVGLGGFLLFGLDLGSSSNVGLEEASDGSATLLAQALSSWAGVFPEDFAGALAADEAGATLWPAPLPDAWLAVGYSAEDFAGSLPADEVGLGQAQTPDPLAPGLSYAAEDFAAPTSLLEEGSPGAQLAFSFDAPQIPAYGEDFSKAAATFVGDEAAAPAVALVDPGTGLAGTPEDFAGTLPVDEPGAPPPAVIDSPIALSSLGEDFGQPSSLFEDPSWAPTPAPFSDISFGLFGYAGEDITSASTSLYEEQGATATTPEWPTPVFASTSEDFARVVGGATGLDELAPGTWAIVDVQPWAYVQPEDFAGSLTADEGSTFAPLVTLDLLPPQSYAAEDLAVATGLFEDPAWLAPPAPFFDITLGLSGFASEDLGAPGSPTNIYEEPAAPSPGAPPFDQGLAFQGEDFGAPPIATGLLEEPGPPPPQAPTFDLGLTFTGEELAAPTSLSEEPAWQPPLASVDASAWLASFEDFADSLASDEGPGAVATVTVDQALGFYLPAEDFAGALPAEEASPSAWLSPDTAWTLGGVDEEFPPATPASALEEYGASPWISVDIGAAPWSAYTDDEFVNATILTLGIDEPGNAQPTPSDDPGFQNWAPTEDYLPPTQPIVATILFAADGFFGIGFSTKPSAKRATAALIRIEAGQPVTKSIAVKAHKAEAKAATATRFVAGWIRTSSVVDASSASSVIEPAPARASGSATVSSVAQAIAVETPCSDSVASAPDVTFAGGAHEPTIVSVASPEPPTLEKYGPPRDQARIAMRAERQNRTAWRIGDRWATRRS